MIEAVSLVLLVAVVGLAFRYFLKRRRRLRRRALGAYWSVGHQRSDNPFSWSPTTANVLKGQRDFPYPITNMADPFVIRQNNKLYLFCEVGLKSAPVAKIGMAEMDISENEWRYQGIVLDEPFHLSYPYVFSDGSDYFMLPESKQAHSVRLYRATDFPNKWSLHRVLLNNCKWVDPCIIERDGTWYLFVSRKRQMHLFYADSLEGTWTEHPRSPVRRRNHARGAGRIIELDGSLYRFAQEQSGGYGQGVHAFHIVTLSRQDFFEEAHPKNPILVPQGTGWAGTAMHHIDILRLDEGNYFAVFDGEGVVP